MNVLGSPLAGLYFRLHVQNVFIGSYKPFLVHKYIIIISLLCNEVPSYHRQSALLIQGSCDCHSSDSSQLHRSHPHEKRQLVARW